MEDAFDNDDLETVAERLVGMQGSLRLLWHVADYQVKHWVLQSLPCQLCNVIRQERVAHLEQHRNRLEATLSPLLVTAFSSLDTAAALRLVNMFRSMERGGQLTKYPPPLSVFAQRWVSTVQLTLLLAGTTTSVCGLLFSSDGQL